jgi:hypothetical protein
VCGSIRGWPLDDVDGFVVCEMIGGEADVILQHLGEEDEPLLLHRNACLLGKGRRR